MSNIFLKNKIQGNKIFRMNRPFSSINSRGSISMNQRKKVEILPKTNKSTIKSVIEQNLYQSLILKSTRATYTRNNFNKFNSFDLKGKKYSNYSVFIKRKKSPKFKKIISRTIQKKLTKQMSASQLNPKKIFRDGIFNLTNLYLKKPRKIENKNKLRNYFFQRKYKINLAKKIFQDNIQPNIESQIIDNHKYKNVILLKKIETDKSLRDLSSNLEEEKNNYLMNKKLEYISYKAHRSKDLSNYMVSMDQYIKGTYTNELMAEKEKIISEEINNENLYLNSKISTLKNTKKLYQDLFLNKFNEYVKFLTKTVDKYDKVDYLLVNEILSLQKKIDYLKKKINSLLESKKTYNKFIILQIKLKKKTMKLPDYYEFILNHSLQESIEHCMGVLDEEGVKKIYKYKNKVIYKSYDAFNYQFKSYENENREHLTKLGILQRDINRLNFEKKEVIKEGNNIEKYFNEKIREKSQEKLEVINKYNSLINERNNLLTEIKFTFRKVKNSDKKSKNKHSSVFFRDFDTNNYTTKKTISFNNTNNTFKNITNKTNNAKSNKIKNRSFATANAYNLSRKYLDSTTDKYKLSIDEQILVNLNIIYESNEKNFPNSNLYLKIRQLYLLLKNFNKKDETFKKAQKISTENGLILKLLEHIEIAMDIFLEREREFDERYKEEIYKVKQKIDKERKIIKGQKYKSMLKARNENMKRKIEEKAKKLYFLPKTKKRTVSANINKKIKNKKLKKLVEKNEYELLVDYFKEN